MSLGRVFSNFLSQKPVLLGALFISSVWMVTGFVSWA